MKKVLANLEEIIGGILFIGMLLVLSVQIVARVVLDQPLTWSEALAKFLFVYVGYLAVSMGIKENGHVYIDYFVLKFPRKVQLGLYYLFQGVIFVVIALMGYIGFEMAMRKVPVEMVALGISYVYMYAALPLISVLMLFRLIERLVTEPKPYHKEEL